jgi:hypothetical protein
MKTPENKEEDPDVPEPAHKGDVQMEYYSDYLFSPNLGAVTKDYLYELKSVKVLFKNLEYLIIWQLFGPVGVKLMEFYCTEETDNQAASTSKCLQRPYSRLMIYTSVSWTKIACSKELFC